MSIVLTDLQKVTLSVSFVDAAGNPATLDVVPVWATSDPTVLTIVSSVDGLSAVASTVGPLGTAQITVTAPGDAGTVLTGIADFQVIGSKATAINVTVGTPELR